MKQKQKLTKELFEDDDDGLEGKEIREKEHKKHDIIISSSSIFVFIWFQEVIPLGYMLLNLLDLKN